MPTIQYYIKSRPQRKHVKWSVDPNLTDAIYFVHEKKINVV